MIIPVFIPHWGCPHKCIFCNQRTISGQKQAGLQEAREQIERYLSYGTPSPQHEIAFYGGSFTALPLSVQRELLLLAREYRENGAAGAVRLSTRPDCINEEIVAQLVELGVETVELGVQSLDDAVLRQAERGHNAACVAPALGLLRHAGLKVGIQLMVGLPGQDEASIERTTEEVILMHPDIVRIYPVLVIAGTELAEMFRQEKYHPLELEEAVRLTYGMYERFAAQGIKVIRMGLQPDGELCKEGNILAGPFHPSFGELVKSYGYRLRVLEYISSLPQGTKGIIVTHRPEEASLVRGNRKANLLAWQAVRNLQINFEIGDKFSVRCYNN